MRMFEDSIFISHIHIFCFHKLNNKRLELAFENKYGKSVFGECAKLAFLISIMVYSPLKYF